MPNCTSKIMRDLREALAIASGKKKPAMVAHFVECSDCGNFVRLASRCSECRARLYGAHGEQSEQKE